MALLHRLDDKLLICASSKVFSTTHSLTDLEISNVIDVKVASDLLPLPKKGSVEDKKDEKTAGKVESFQILCSATSSCGSLLAVGTSSKTILIIDSKTLQLRRGFRIPKAPTSVTFDRDNSHIVVGDRAGNVCRYTVEASDKLGYVDMNGEDSPYEGEPLSSAITMVLDVAVSEDGRFLLAADRDEKIRISRYPNAFVVQSFCLGHSAYVSSVALHKNRVFSSGGDSIVHEWDIENGKSIAQSEKLCADPIRRLRILPKDDNFYLVVIAGSKLFFLDSQLQSVKNVEVSNEIMDITASEGNVIGVSSSGVFLYNFTEGALKTLTIPTELAEALSTAKYPISSYFKNVTHQNMVDYYKRKAEKIENMRENQNRKRKAKEQRRRAAKRLAAEKQAVC